MATAFEMSDQAERGAAEVFDAVIVGAGVSGLLAAHELLTRRPARVLLIDAGLPLDERRAQPTPPMGGYGGAGLFLGGRLYLGEASVPVGSPVTSPPELRPVIQGDAYVRRANEVDQLFDALGAHAEWQPRPPEPLEQAISQAQAAGLDYIVSYPSRRLGPDDKVTVLSTLREHLEARGARFLFQAQVSDITQVNDRFQVVAQSESGEQARIQTRTLLLAPGRYGAEWLTQTARSLGARVVAAPSTFGVRVEVPSAVYAPLTNVNPDPRLQMATGEDAIFKTYATCPGGVVAPIARYGALVASGVPVMRREDRGSNTTLAALAQPGVEGARGVWAGGEECARLLNARAPGHLIVQRWGDVRRAQPTTATALAANRVHLSDHAALPGALHDAYPQAYWRAFAEFLRRLDQLAPGVDADDTLLYGPAEERFWAFPTDDTLQTSVAGLFVAGDGAGQSQGIIQASVAGLLAGEGMARILAERGTLA